jgi:hypothetical protein
LEFVKLRRLQHLQPRFVEKNGFHDRRAALASAIACLVLITFVRPAR